MCFATKAQDGKLSCLEVIAAALPPEEQEKLIPKHYCELPTFPAYVRNTGTTLASPNLKVREMDFQDQVHILPFQGMGVFRWVQRMSPHAPYCSFRRKREEKLPAALEKHQFTGLLCHLLERGKNFLPSTPDCRTYIPFKPKHENMMLMFKAKLTSNKFFVISSFLMSSGPKIIHGNPSVETFSIGILCI